MRLEGVVEVPTSWFRDGFGRVRPAQLCASSIGEFEHLLVAARSQGWRVVTLLFHSFELVRRQPPEREQKVMRLHDQRLLQPLSFADDAARQFCFGDIWRSRYRSHHRRCRAVLPSSSVQPHRPAILRGGGGTAVVTSMLEWSESAHRLKLIFGEYCLFSISFRAVELATPVTRLGDCLDRSAAAALPFLGRYGAVAIPSHRISAAPGRLKMSRGLLRYVSEITVHYLVEPGGSFDEYFSQRPRRYRHELLRKLRRFADAAEIDLRVYRSPDESKAFYPIALAISGKTYQRRLLDVGLPEAAGFKAELSARAGCGASRGYLLFHRETAIAYAYATVAGDHLRFRWIGTIRHTAPCRPELS